MEAALQGAHDAGVRRETVLTVLSFCMLTAGCGSADKAAPGSAPATASPPVESSTKAETAAVIPAAFHGIYEISSGCAAAAEAGGMTDGAILVRADSIDSNEGWCDLKSVSAASATAFMGVFECASEGETDERTRAIRIAQDEKFMFDDYATPYQRCSKDVPHRPQFAAAEGGEEEAPRPAPALELPMRLSCAKTAISRWEDGTVIYDFGMRPATVVFVQEKYIFSGTFTRESKTRATLELQGVLNVSTGQLSGGVNRTEHLEVLAVDANGLYTLKNSAGMQYCLADESAPPNNSDSEPVPGSRSQPLSSQASASQPSGISKDDAFVASYARELSASWMQSGACGQLLGVMQQMSRSSAPANVRVLQMEKVFDKAYDIGCIMQ